VLEVTRQGSATAAARRLGASPSTLTRRVARLEVELGTALFRRERDGLVPTEAGQRVAGVAARMEAELNQLSVVPDDAVSGTVRVATTEGLALLLVEQGLCALRRRHPALVLELLGGNRPVDLGAGEADLAVRTARPDEARVRVRRLATLELALCASERYRHGAAIGDDLTGHDVIVPGGELAALPEARWLEELPGVRVAFRSSSMPALQAAVRLGVGLGVQPIAWAALDPQIRVVCPAPIEPRALWLAFAPEAHGRAAVRAVAEQIEAIAAGARL